jgi:hypothetical protein
LRKKNEKMMSYLEDGRHPMNSEIEDEAESMSEVKVVS